MKKAKNARNNVAPKFPLNPLAIRPHLQSIKQHLASIEKVADIIAEAFEKETSLKQYLARMKKTISDCESRGEDLLENDFWEFESSLTLLDQQLAKGKKLKSTQYHSLEEFILQSDKDKLSQIKQQAEVVDTMFVICTEQEIFGFHHPLLPPECITWIFAAARFLPPVSEEIPEDELLALYRYVNQQISAKELLAISNTPCVSAVADCLEARCANLFLLMCAVFLEQTDAGAEEASSDAFWTVEWKPGARRVFRNSLREDFSEYFSLWDVGEMIEAEKLLYASRSMFRADCEETDIRIQYKLPDVPLLDSEWMTVALCFSVWTRKKFGKFGRIAPEAKGEPSFVGTHRKLLTAIDNIRILLAVLAPQQLYYDINLFFGKEAEDQQITEQTTIEEMEQYFHHGGLIDRFLLLLAKAAGQTENDAQTVNALFRACLHQEAVPAALFALSETKKYPTEKETSTFRFRESIRRNYIEVFHGNTEISFGNNWHPVPPFSVLNAICYAITCLMQPSGKVPKEALKEDIFPVSAQLPGGVYDFAALVASLLEGHSVSVLRKERRERRQLPALHAAKRMLGEEELAKLQEELAMTKAALSDAQAAASLSAGDALRSLQSRATTAEHSAKALAKEVSSLQAEVSRLKAALTEKAAAFDALLDSIQQPAEETETLSAEELSAKLSKLSFAFVGGHIQRLRELRDLGIIPKLTINATRAPKSASVDVVVIFTDWTSHKNYYAAESVRKACGAERVFVSGTTSTPRILQMMWDALPQELKARCE